MRQPTRSRAGATVTRVVVVALIFVVLGTGIAAATGPNPFSFPWDRPDLPAAKATMIARQDQAILNARKTPYAKPPKAVVDATMTAVVVHRTQSPLPTPTFTSGIFQGGSDAFVNRDFGSANHWVGEVSGTWYDVFAGVRHDPGADTNRHGALIVISCANPCQTGHQQTSRYDAPTGTAGVKITGVTGTTITLVSETGATLTFDLLTHQFSAPR